MPLNTDSALDALAMVIRTVRDSADLQNWFQGLAQMPENTRQEAIARIADEMKSQREPDELVTAFGLLAHPYFFNATAAALRDCGVAI